MRITLVVDVDATACPRFASGDRIWSGLEPLEQFIGTLVAISFRDELGRLERIEEAVNQLGKLEEFPELASPGTYHDFQGMINQPIARALVVPHGLMSSDMNGTTYTGTTTNVSNPQSASPSDSPQGRS